MSPYPYSRRSKRDQIWHEDPYIQYLGAWTRRLIPGENETMTGTTQVGDNATFVFSGYEVEVHGIELPQTTRNSSYVVDHGVPTIYSSTSPVHTPSQYKMFFKLSLSSNGNHTLVVTNYGDSLWLNYIWIDGVALYPDGDTGSHTPPNAPTATIVGATLGALVFCLILVGITWYLRWRTHERSARSPCVPSGDASMFHWSAATGSSSWLPTRTPEKSSTDDGHISLTSGAFPMILPPNVYMPRESRAEGESDVWDNRLSRGYSLENPTPPDSMPPRCADTPLGRSV